MRDQLKAGLAATAQAQGDDAKPAISELAEKIKTLKAANTIEATPQRARQKQSTAEEPITARIRRRAEAIPNADRSMPSHSAYASALRDSEAQDSSAKPAMSFQERLAAERIGAESHERSL